MVTQQDRHLKRLRQLRDSVIQCSCPVCCEHYISHHCVPQVASCGHTLCQKCWNSLAKPLQCPICRERTIQTVPNYALLELMREVRDIMKARHVSEEVLYRQALLLEEKKIQLEERTKKHKKI